MKQFLLTLCMLVSYAAHTQSDNTTAIAQTEFFEWEDQKYSITRIGIQTFIEDLRDVDRHLANQMTFEYNKIKKKDSSGFGILYTGLVIGGSLMLYSAIDGGGDNGGLLITGLGITTASAVIGLAVSQPTTQQDLRNVLNTYNRITSGNKIDFTLGPIINNSKIGGVVGISLKF